MRLGCKFEGYFGEKSLSESRTLRAEQNSVKAEQKLNLGIEPVWVLVKDFCLWKIERKVELNGR